MREYYSEEESAKDTEQDTLNDRIEKADHVVSVAVGTTAATGAIPIPFADAPLLIGQQVALLAAISGIFEIDVKKDGLKALVTAAMGVGGAALIGKTITTNVIKLIPGAGSVVGGAISGGTAGALTFAVGKAYIEMCKSVKMGELGEEDMTKEKGIHLFKDYFKAQVKNREE